jgi:hypothetical protein
MCLLIFCKKLKIKIVKKSKVKIFKKFKKSFFGSAIHHFFIKLCPLKQGSAPPGREREFSALPFLWGSQIERN